MKVNGWIKIHQANSEHKKAAVALLIAEKVDFKRIGGTQAKEGKAHGQRIHPLRSHNPICVCI